MVNLSRYLCVAAVLCSGTLFAQLSQPSLADIKTTAEAGDPVAQMKLGDRFMMQLDSAQAEVWYRKAAEQGYAPAQGQLAARLLMQFRIAGNRSAQVRAARGDEAVKWAALAANLGDQQGQATLADIYLEGKLVKPDLVQAYKWGDLAALGSGLATAAISGRSTRNSAILKMTPAQIAEAKQLVAAFKRTKLPKVTLPEPAWVRQIKLTGLSGTPKRRLALINGTTFLTGETSAVKVAGKTVKVRCLEIRETSVLVEIEGLPKPRELSLSTNP